MGIISDGYKTFIFADRYNSKPSGQYSKWTVGPLSSATCAPKFMQFTGCQQPVQGFYWSENAVENANNMHNATCVDTQTLIEWPYCSFLYCVKGL